MADYGFAGGLASGFGTGVDAGTRIGEVRLKREALIREQIMAQIETAERYANDHIKYAVSYIEGSPNRTAPEFNNGLGAMKSQIEDAAKMLESLGPQGAQASQRILSNLNIAISSARTKSEQFAAGVDAKMQYALGDSSVQAQPAPDQQQQIAQAPQQAQPATDRAYPGMGAPVQPKTGVTPPAAQPTMMAQAQAGSQAAPQPQPVAQQPVAPAAHGFNEVSHIPVEDIEVVVADPSKTEEFIREYGVDPATLFAAPKMDGQELNEREMRMQAAGMDPYTPERKAIAGENAKVWKERTDKFNAARQTLVNNHRSRKLLRSGMFTGLGADWKLWISRANLALQGDNPDPELQQKVANTEQYLGSIVNEVATLIKNFGAGTGLSDSDRQFAYQAVGGDITFNEKSLTDLMRARSEMALWIMKNPDLAKPMEKGEFEAAMEQYRGSKGWF